MNLKPAAFCPSWHSVGEHCVTIHENSHRAELTGNSTTDIKLIRYILRIFKLWVKEHCHLQGNPTKNKVHIKLAAKVSACDFRLAFSSISFFLDADNVGIDVNTRSKSWDWTACDKRINRYHWCQSHVPFPFFSSTYEWWNQPVEFPTRPSQ